jgi:pepF/M3 family oligoendopeptidase
MARELGALPHWDVTAIYPSIESDEWKHAVRELDLRLAEHEAALDRDGIGGKAARVEADDARLARTVEGFIVRTNWLAARLRTLDAYVSAHVTTNSFDARARQEASVLEARGVRLEAAELRFLSWSRGIEGRLDAIVAASPTLAAHRFALEETLRRSRHLMSEAEELLASDLAPAGGSAWERLHGVITSQIEVALDRGDGKPAEKLPMSKVRALAADPDADVRRRAYEAELAAWRLWREPIAAALNGVKGWASKVVSRRGYAAPIEPALEMNRMDRATLDALLGAMRDSFPAFRRYLKAKARALGKDRCSWHDIFAPVGKASKVWTWAAAEEFILARFATFSERLAAYAKRAFAERWIDAEPRTGKVGGGFCMGIPEAKASRILMNFDGTFDQVSTLAHELGHGYHNEVLKDIEPLRRRTPMTLAETASIFCETIAFNGALAEATDDAERLAILDTYLIGACQVVVDIYSRYLFETRVFERRAERELSADELGELMVAAEREAYGDALDDRLHPFMWAVKPHYYSADHAFYNYPYAFGLLFGLGLYAIYGKRGKAFVADYDSLLGSTGLGMAADLARRFGIDIRTRAFWEDGLGYVGGLIDRYERLVASL